jgi:hypothetical protein
MEEELDRINSLHLWDFEVAQNDDGALLLLGSNDFVYSHYLEAEFHGVVFTDVPERFSHAEFRLGKDGTVWIRAEGNEYEIQATSLEVRIGRVYYYEREDLKPGERIASHHRRG